MPQVVPDPAVCATVAALYVDVESGPYAHLEGVDCWGVQRDGRLYQGPHPVVAHPPCVAWGAYRLNRMVMVRRNAWTSADFDASGAEMICGVVAVEQVRRWGGVLEHPAHSGLWQFCGLPRPGLFRDEHGGMTVEVYQGAYGHVAPKRTWIYVVGADAAGYFAGGGATTPGRVQRMWSNERHLTPRAFAVALVELARSCQRPSENLPGGGRTVLNPPGRPRPVTSLQCVA